MKFALFSTILAASLSASAAASQTSLPATEGFSAGRENLPEVANEAWDATVQIQKINRMCAEKADSRSWGTGVIVHYDSGSHSVIVATNSHVINGCQSGLASLSVGFLKPGSNDAHRISSDYKVLRNDRGVDFALLRVRLPKKTGQPSVARLGKATVNGKVLAIGYPDMGARRDWNAEVSGKSKNMRRYSFGYARSIAPRYPINAETSTGRPVIHYGPVILHSADILPGNSGGPLVNENGEVVGLNTKMIRSLAPEAKRRQGKDNYFYCANAPVTEMNCQNLSISSELIVRELEKLF